MESSLQHFEKMGVCRRMDVPMVRWLSVVRKFFREFYPACGIQQRTGLSGHSFCYRRSYGESTFPDHILVGNVSAKSSRIQTGRYRSEDFFLYTAARIDLGSKAPQETGFLTGFIPGMLSFRFAQNISGKQYCFLPGEAVFRDLRGRVESSFSMTMYNSGESWLDV